MGNNHLITVRRSLRRAVAWAGVPALVVTALLAVSFAATPAGASEGGVSFSAPEDYVVGAPLEGIVAGDLTGDGQPDLVIADAGDVPIGQVNNQGGVSVLLNHGDGTFGAASTYPSGGFRSEFPAVGDFNGDGHADVVVNDEINNGSPLDLSLLRGDGSGGLGAPLLYPSDDPAGLHDNPQGVVGADFNGDGVDDVAVANSHNRENLVDPGSIGVLLGQRGSGGGGGLGPVTAYHNSFPMDEPSNIALGDFNNDGHEDLVYDELSDVTVRLGDGAGNFGPPIACDAPQSFPFQCQPNGGQVAVGDFNSDGNLDAAITNFAAGGISLVFGDGTGHLRGYTAIDSCAGVPTPADCVVPDSVDVADFNRDGNPDLLIGDGFLNTVLVQLGNGDGTFQAPQQIGQMQDFPTVTHGDFNGDGRPDIAGSSQGGGDVKVWLNTTPPDATPPTTTIAVDPSAPNGSNGWYTGSVHATVSAVDNDNGSGVHGTRCVLDPATPPATYSALPAITCPYLGPGADVSGDGTHVIYAASIDNAGNAETPVHTSIKIDATPPTLAPTISSNPLYLNQAGANAAPNASDATSGVAISSCGPIDTSTPGDHIVTCTATDNAGNTGSATAHYVVQYKILGFFSPAPDSKWKAGQSVPIKIALADANNNRITDAGALASTCQVQFSAMGAQTLSPQCMKYDSTDSQFTYTWKLAKLPTGGERITVSVSYAGTDVRTTLSAPVTITRSG